MYKSLLSIVLCIVLAMSASAKSIPVALAGRVAATFLHLDDPEDLHTVQTSFAGFHVFDIEGGGFVIVSADDRVQPVLAYSLTSDFSAKDMPANVRWWLEGWEEQISAIMENNALPTHPDWQPLTAGFAPKALYDTTVGPLMETEWGQNPYYNELCPENASGVKTVTGCVATAMGQVMRYWQWPDVGVDSHSYTCPNYGTQSANFGTTTYDWAHMPNRLTAISDSADIAAVATLLYHCGVAVDMVYGTLSQGGSAAYDIMYEGYDLNTPCAENALRTYFKYSPALYGAARKCFTDAEWAALMKNEIDHRRPVLYGGGGPAGGHEFVCDGYDTNGFFSFNWGYDGDDNGFFSLGNVAIDANYSFNRNQTAIIGIKPDTLYGSNIACMVTAVSADASRGSVAGGGTYPYRDTVTLTATAAEGYRFHCWSNGATVNPYQLLAHDVSLEAIFKGALMEDSDTLSYTGTMTEDIGVYSMFSNYRMGIKIPAEFLQGHNCLTAVDNYTHNHPIVVHVHIGGDDAPGPIVHSQQYQGSESVFAWHRIVLDSAVAITPDSNLWITIQPMDEDIIFGANNIDVPDANWFSDDNGATWGHLPDYPVPFPHCRPGIAWLIRCITSPAASVGIEEVAVSNVTVTTTGLLLTVNNPDGRTVRIYDIMGRQLSTSRLATFTTRLPTIGVYLVVPDGQPAHKVVAILQ